VSGTHGPFSTSAVAVRWSAGALDPDTTFGTDGVVTIDDADASALAIAEADGRYVVAGQRGSGEENVLWGLTTAGALDTSFATDGEVAYDRVEGDVVDDLTDVVAAWDGTGVLARGIVTAAEEGTSGYVFELTAGGGYDGDRILTTDWYDNHDPGEEMLGIDAKGSTHTALVRDFDETPDWYGAVKLRVNGFQDWTWETNGTTGDVPFRIEHGTIEDRYACQNLVIGGTIDGVAALGRLEAWCDS
jgi:hypothetical protein